MQNKFRQRENEKSISTSLKEMKKLFNCDHVLLILYEYYPMQREYAFLYLLENVLENEKKVTESDLKNIYGRLH